MRVRASSKPSGLQKNKLRAARQAAGIDSGKLASLARVPLSRLRDIERGATATVNEWAQLAYALDEAPAGLVSDLDEFLERVAERVVAVRQEREIERQGAERLRELQEQSAITRSREATRLSKQEQKEREKLHSRLRQVHSHAAEADRNIFVRELSFPTQYHDAGVTILQGFIRLLRERYAERELSASIRQEDTKLTLIVEGVNGFREEVSEYLDRYGDVVMGKQPISVVTSDRLVTLELHNQLNIARSQLETQREITQLLRSDLEHRVRAMEGREKWMQEQIGFAITSLAGELQAAIAAVEKGSHLAVVLAQAKEAIEKPPSTDKKKTAVRESLETITKEGVAPGIADSIKTLVAKLLAML